MSKKDTFYEQLTGDAIVSNLMALNGVDPLTVYRKQTMTLWSFGITSVFVGIFTAFIIMPVGIGFIVVGLIVLIMRGKNIHKIKKMLAEQKENAPKNEREALKEEVRREMLKEELRAEIEAEKASKKSEKKEIIKN